jgi:hypothetical protein
MVACVCVCVCVCVYFVFLFYLVNLSLVRFACGDACKTKCSSTTLAHGGVDLMMVDIYGGMPTPSISSPSNIVPLCNERSIDKVEAIFEFVYSLLHDNDALIIFVP